jgi:DNA polymerase III gamma/tau subunit
LIPNASLRARRLLQLAQQWQILDPPRGQEVLKRAEEQARKSISLPGRDEKILTDIYLEGARLDPTGILSQSWKAASPSVQARVLLEAARVLQKASVEENVKILEKALQMAQKKKNARLTAAISMAWFSLDPAKSLEVLARVESREIRVQTLRQMAWQSFSVRKDREEGRRLLERATQEALGVDGLGGKIQSLHEIAGDWTTLDKERAKATYLKAYQLAEKAEFTSPKF